MTTWRGAYARLCSRALDRCAHPAVESLMQRSAVVFSPHYDDETLGVGGTIIKKRASGATVHVVFMTDGSRSHAHAMDGKRLSEIRRAEALSAMDRLGVPRSHVTFLEFPETRLAEHRAEVVDRVADLLAQLPCEQVFVPSRLEPLLWSADHNVTTDVVFEALTRIAKNPEVLEYLVWFWYHWPWVPLSHGADVRQLMRLTWQGRFGLSGWRDLNTAVPIAAVLAQKRSALEQYASQMVRLSDDKPWPVLGDVGRGDFLECFFQPRELFTRYTFQGLPEARHR